MYYLFVYDNPENENDKSENKKSPSIESQSKHIDFNEWLAKFEELAKYQPGNELTKEFSDLVELFLKPLLKKSKKLPGPKHPASKITKSSVNNSAAHDKSSNLERKARKQREKTKWK